MPFRIAQLFDNPGSGLPDFGEMIRQAGIDVDYVKANCTTEAEIVEAARTADGIICVATFQPLSRQVIEQLTRCRFIMSMGIGFDRLDVRAATERGILAANVPDYCQEEMSDHVMALILASTRKIITLNTLVRKGGWRQDPEPDIQRGIWPTMSRLRDQTLGIVGLGRIARILVPKAKGFGMRIIAHDPYLDAGQFTALGVEKVELDTLLSESDFITLHAPLTAATRHLLGPEQFQKMKMSAYLINTARGGLVDQAALYEALAAGRLAGAALDVTDPEPIRPDDPLLTL
ncbi:MAG: D-isomer specific 2-hydroxyacid dehydrogenase NAD-binding protein, partial [Deltaproteobacteria bacterium]|nr:D-isomer specific 2-hydroxyacid dehydrogenase NAD-binding protein [Deltaproteobacteria bacterium]